MSSSSVQHWVNGQAGEHISVLDRGLLYGQSVFETIAVSEQQPLLLEEHVERLSNGCDALSIPFDESIIINEIESICDTVEQQCVLRVTLTMGEGGRGYQNPEQASANRIMSLHEFPNHPKDNWQDGIHLGLSEIRLAQQPALASIKHGNKLEQILARSQWQADWQEAVLLDQAGSVIEATQSNLFIVNNSQLKTPDLQQCGVAGVMRNFVVNNAHKITDKCAVVPLSLRDIETADEVFVTNSIIGLWPVKQFQQQQFSDFSVSHKLLTLMQDHGAIPTL